MLKRSLVIIASLASLALASPALAGDRHHHGHGYHKKHHYHSRVVHRSSPIISFGFWGAPYYPVSYVSYGPGYGRYYGQRHRHHGHRHHW